ncbi:MAG: hypothetical protein HOW97_12200 [Catenulispora sp.]|nr:hypothetical protein [Catenulispora sp.]
MPGITPPTPYNWNVGDVASSSLLNAQLYNGLTFLLNPPYFFGYQLSATAQAIASSGGTFVTVVLDAELVDTEGGHSTTTNNSRYTCQIAGRYQVDGAVTFAATSTTGFRAAKFLLNGGSTVVGSETMLAASSFDTTARASTDVYLNVGDYIELQCLQNSAANPLNLTSNAALDYATHMRVRWIAAT